MSIITGMRTAFTIIAIFAAVVLLVRYAAPAATPRFGRSKRIENKAMIKSIRALGARCAVTEHGFGIFGSIKINGIIDDCKKRVLSGKADEWQYVLCRAEDSILAAMRDGKKDARHSIYCGHVGKYPRVYLFCEMLVGLSGCDISGETILSALSAFEENAKLSDPERKILCGMLKFCLIGFLHNAVKTAFTRDKMYESGVRDGNCGRIDLDKIVNYDYVCGLRAGFSSWDGNAAQRIFECNNIDVELADNSRRTLLAETYLTVNAVLRSLAAIDEVKDQIYSDVHDSIHAVRYEKVFNILFPILLALYALFTCIFASPDFVALFSVAALITYCVLRIPILLYSPKGGINIFSSIEKLLIFKKSDNAVDDRMFISETAFFGGEPEYIETEIKGELTLCCDNRGRVVLKSANCCDRMFVGLQSTDVNIDLSECDCAIEPHRAAYRVCKADVEFCAEFLAPYDSKACVSRLTVINRGNENIQADLICAVIRDRSDEQKCITENISGGAFAKCDNGFALAISTGGIYGSEVAAFCASRTLKHVKSNIPAIIGSTSLSIKRFERKVLFIAVAYARGTTEAESMIRHIFDRSYFFRTEQSTQVYCKQNILPDSNTVPEGYITSHKAPQYPAPDLPDKNTTFSLSFGGVDADGVFVINDNKSIKPIDNIFGNFTFGMRSNQFGIQNITLFGRNITSLPDIYSYVPRVFAVIGEDGEMWSPTLKPLGKGTMRSELGRGFSEYTCAYNGTVCTQKCFCAINAPYVFIEITLGNKADTDRRFDIMFTAECDDGTVAERTEKGIRAGELLFCAVDEDAECALYKEGYYIYGHIAKTSAFRAGGCTVAPTVSVKKTVAANSIVRTVFCITRYNNELPDSDSVKSMFDEAQFFFRRLKIGPKTDDQIFNLSIIQSLYSAYGAFSSNRSMSLSEECFVLSAAKYADSRAVKKRITDIISTQSIDGRLGNYDDCLRFVSFVIEFVEFVGDDSFWYKTAPYATSHAKSTGADSIYDHMLRAVRYIVLSVPPPPNGIVRQVWRNKSLMNVLRYFECNLKRDPQLYAICKKQFVTAAESYAFDMKRLAKNNYYEFDSISEAFMCAALLFDMDLNEKAYNIVKFNDPLRHLLRYGDRYNNADFDYFSDPVAAAIYFTVIVERLFGVKFRGKKAKICPHTAANTPKIAFDICGKTKTVHITVEDNAHSGNWKMKVNRINYPADSVDIGDTDGDIVFYRD